MANSPLGQSLYRSETLNQWQKAKHISAREHVHPPNRRAPDRLMASKSAAPLGVIGDPVRP